MYGQIDMTGRIESWSTFALAVLSFAALGVSYFGIKKQTKSFADSVAADLCLKLLDRFDSPEMLAIRNKGAKALLSGSNLQDADEVFDFFEIVGLYVRKEMLDIEVAHSFFFHWVNLYWCSGKEYVKKSRERSADLYRDFEALYKAVLKIEMERAPKSRDINPTEIDLKAFLQLEESD